ncbi:hypothetical protein PSV08DRAFT_250439 [Bipolaris maydis]|nr:hypothetical protein J3E73DRAFT_261055 [Bipolaris maydis]KAJ6268142.1 hypothetical protein PSV08DRAFT_250439 [Bipolaris maydis]
MADQHDINIRFCEEFNNAKALHDDGRLDECVAKARGMLEDPDIPRYHRIKTLLMLASALEDPYEASKCWLDATALWTSIRFWNPEGQNSKLDELMEEIRMSLEELSKAVENEEAEEHDESIVHVHDDQVADTQAMIQRMEINEDNVDMDSGGEDVAAGSASQVQVQPVQEPLPSTEKVESFDITQHMQSANYFLRTQHSSRDLQINWKRFFAY